ncbi:MAG: glutamine cyclotransferase [Gemmatimonadetes bacterium]|nr:glutamine cyclotransferase [Gemmatimonadota bacterium]
MLGCGRGSERTVSEGSAAILPSMLPPASTNADAAPPRVPFSDKTPKVMARARASWPHDTAAYTQGLLFEGERLVESTGGEGRSELREVERRSGRVLSRSSLPNDVFGEGIAVAADRIFQLTWKGERGYEYDARSLARRDSFTYVGEGWGVASVGSQLYMSDGSSTLRIFDPHQFREVGRLEVREGEKAVWMLNELELVGDELWANIYQTDLIARISPSTGRIVGWVDLSRLLTARERADVERRGGVANGIAFDASRRVVLVTGKLWPRVFELDLRDVSVAATHAP